GSLYDVGQQLISFLHAHGYEKKLPYFWYDAKDDGGELGSLQSLYYYSYTYLGIAMPTLDKTFRSRFELFHRPSQLVLLCATPSCDAAAGALRRAGYRPRLRADDFLKSHMVRVWVRIYDIHAAA